MTANSTTTTPDRLDTGAGSGFLPDFCNIRIVFIVVVSAQLLAFVLALGVSGAGFERWHALSLLSLFTQWIALTCTVLLCVGRQRLNRLGAFGSGCGALALVLVVTALVSELVYVLGRDNGLAQLMPATAHGEFLLRNLAVAAIFGAVLLRFFYVQQRTRQTVEAESRARFQALQARIRPHFMFNSMNTIASLTRSDPALAEEVVEDLADLFRSSLVDDRRENTLAEELELVRRYLRIEALRLGERLRVVNQTAGLPMDARVPPLLLQPLVENAIYHGIEPLPTGGIIRIVGAVHGGQITITISNPLSPVTPAGQTREGHHMALANTRERLLLHFDHQGGLETWAEDGEFITRLVFPVRTEGGA